MITSENELLRGAQSAYHSTVRFAEPETIAAAGRIMSEFRDLDSAKNAIIQDVAPMGR